MPRIIISYRRDDAGIITGRIYDRLVSYYGRDSIFRDIDNIPIGVDFRRHVNEVLKAADIVLAIVGPNWIGPSESEPRLNDPADPVRVEIETALRSGSHLVPVLVMGAAMPTAALLPESLRDFAYRNAIRIGAADEDFDDHIRRLTRGLDRLISAPQAAPATEARTQPKSSSRLVAGLSAFGILGGAAAVWIAISHPSWDESSTRSNLGTGLLEVSAKPSQAILKLDGKPPVPAQGFREALAPGDHDIEIDADGYESHREKVTIVAGMDKSLAIALVKPPPPPPTTGTLELSVAPPSATVVLDGKPMGNAAGFRREISPGQHTLEIDADGYEPQRQTIAITAGVDKSLAIELIKPSPPSPTTGTLELSVTPASATLKLDGNALGNATGFRREISPGQHTLEIDADGYEPQRQTIAITAGMDKSLTIALVKQPPLAPTTGTLDLSATPVDAVLTLDGKVVGMANGFHENLPAGDHVIEIHANGYETQRQTVSVSPGVDKSLMIALVKPPPTTGILDIDATPLEAVLAIDGKTVGTASGFRQQLLVGNHTIAISADGYETQQQSVSIAPGDNRSLMIALVPTTGTITLDVSPPDAMLQLDGKPMGAALNFHKRLSPGAHQLEISAAGYTTRQEKVEVSAGSDKTLSVALAALPPPAAAPTTGILTLDVPTPGATVHLDGADAGPAEEFRRNLSPGTHVIEIAAEGYQTVSQAITITAGTEKSVMIELPKPAGSSPAPPTTGVLAISVDPKDALVTIDGKRSGRDGSVREEIKPGDHTIAVGAKGFTSQKVSVHVDAGETVNVPLMLARLPQPPPRRASQPFREEQTPYRPPPVVSVPVPAPAPQPLASAPAAPPAAAPRPRPLQIP